MASEIQKIVLKRGTTAKAVAYTGPVGEVVVDTDLQTLRVQNNVTPGGVVLSKVGHVHDITDVSGLQSALNAKSPVASPAFTGTPSAPTAVAGTDTTQLATTAFVKAAVTGGTGTAAKLTTARTIALTGDATGSVAFDGSQNVSITVAVADDSHLHAFANITSLPTTLAGYGISDAQATDPKLTAITSLATNGLVTKTAAGTMATRSVAVSGTGLSVTNADGVAGNPTVTLSSTAANTMSTVVARDAAGNFSATTIAAELSGNASTATKLATSRTLAVTGDATGSASFDGSANAGIALTLAASGATAGTYKSVTVDAKGRVTTGTNPTTLAGYGIDDAQPLDAELTAFAGLSTNGLVAKTAAGAAVTRSVAVVGTGLSVSNADGVAGNPTITLNSTSASTASTLVVRDVSGSFSAGTITAALAGNAATATSLSTARNVAATGDATWSVSFDGSNNVSNTLTLAASGVTAGTYKSVTVDAKGRVTTGTNPTTLAGYGITDALGSSTYTASDVLTKLKTVDGAGSGLDADTIDGVESASLARVTALGLLTPASGNLVLDCRDGAI